MARLTANYEQHNLCGGAGRHRVTQGPAPQRRDGLITPPEPPEGEYVTHNKRPGGRSRIGAYTWLRNAQWAADLRKREA
jgi:hypothetical protein